MTSVLASTQNCVRYKGIALKKSLFSKCHIICMCVGTTVFVYLSFSLFPFTIAYINTRKLYGCFWPLLILQVKTGPFAEHSNTLWGISSVAEWTKVNSGLIKMYKAEVCFGIV